MTAVNETQCTSCIHCEVCSHRPKFVAAHDAINDVTVHIGENRMIRLRDMNWITVKPQCQYYRKEVPIHR
jgi:hypothetical protein